MSDNAGLKHPIYNMLPSGIEGIEDLVALALDLRWSWNHGSDEMWRKLDPDLWDATANPWVVLQTFSPSRIESALADPAFRKMMDGLVENRRREAQSPAWFQRKHAQSKLSCVAYFSMEFMLSEALPIYSGGLGNVAGDQLKAASDLGVPVVGIGLLYQQGYFRQVINRDGAQEALYPYNDPGQLPITPLRLPSGEWLRVHVVLPGYSVWLRAWQVEVGRAKLYLLDSNDLANFPPHRGITSELYGGGPELRLKQEILLGIGGWRLLRSLGIQPDVCHLNEGHAALAILERARSFKEETGQSFKAALAATRAGNLFTTHTAVPAGFDRFSPALVEQYLSYYAEEKLGIPIHDLLALGRQNPDDSSEDFNMAYLAIRGSGAVNAVSQLHEKVSRRIFLSVFPRWPEEEIPVGHVTNGVHVPSWESVDADRLWTDACGKDRWLESPGDAAESIRRIPDAKLWEYRNQARASLIDYARERLSLLLTSSGAPAEQIDAAKRIFDPNILTLGFARRFATYKRPNLLLHDPERLLRILTNPEKPMQLIIAGKAHPADRGGQALIQQWTRFIRETGARPRAVFLSDYDMLLTERLVQGVDVWINTPRRPWEASGTSGMKVLVNGGVNLSELDGWWVEAYAPEVGWALGDGREHGDDPAWDAAEANALYDLLEHQVVPEFYARDQENIPTAWIARIRESMARLTPQFSASRTVREYTEQHYVPAAEGYHARAADSGAAGREIADWCQTIEQKWSFLRFSSVKVDVEGANYVYEVEVLLGDLNPDAVRVELYANAVSSDAAPHLGLLRKGRVDGTTGAYIYAGSAPANRPLSDYTARIVPHHDGVAVPLEAMQVLWQR